MNTTIAINTNILQNLFSIPSFDYSSSIKKYEEDSMLNELKSDLGNDLFNSLSSEDKQFILDTEGSIDFGYKADENDLKRIFSSIKNDYQY